MLGAGAVGPGGCGCGSFPYTAPIRAIPGPTGQAVPSKGSEMARHPGKASRRTEHLTVICLTKFYRLLCLTPGYGRNTGKREGCGGEWKQRGILKTSKTRWDWDVFLALAGDVLQGQSAQPGTQGRGRPVWGEPCSTAGQPHLSKDVTGSVAVSPRRATEAIVVRRIRLWGRGRDAQYSH